ncbi:hypothetical protein DPMN_018995 [Dreissena polymorpha]|uniref:Uncharacterized protein n=1 Tax=Dreissena polymorpha TaxID=45954 RepID=A0A9D4NIC9_DREPO|nr:hypothetical protein DPMN_018995 [Dreissena polymorpha]
MTTLLNDPKCLTHDPWAQKTRTKLPYELWLKASTLNHDVTAEKSMTITCSDGTDQITSSYKVDISDAIEIKVKVHLRSPF